MKRVNQAAATAAVKAKRKKKVTMPVARPKPTRLSSVAMAIRLLKTFSQGEAEIGVTSLAHRLGIAKSTVYRLVTTLVSEGLLEQNPENEKYRLGLALFGLGALVRQRMNVATEARSVLFQLREATDETVHLAILDGHDIIYVLNLESNQAIRMRADLGARKPAFCAAEGCAILAFQPQHVVSEILSRQLIGRTMKTVTDPRRIMKVLTKVRQVGYAQEEEQCEAGMRSIAAPIRNSDGHVIAAVGIAGPMQRLPDKTLERFAPLITEAGRVISSRLGYQTPKAP